VKGEKVEDDGDKAIGFEITGEKVEDVGDKAIG
jgi:hypothetical protein